MIACHPHVERRMGDVAVGLIRVRAFPVIGAEVRLRQSDQHPRVIGGAQNFCKAQMRAGFAVVIVGVNEVDPKTLQAQQTLPGSGVSRQRRSHLGVVQRHE